MKIYKIKVNGKTYKVELEAVEEAKTEAAPAAAPAPAAPKAEEPKKEIPAGEGKDVVSPIQGTIVRFLVNPGDSVKKGQVLFIVEAMKLENEVVSPYEGTIGTIYATKGQNVAAKERILSVK